MRYYLIYMYQNKVVDVCSYDNEEAQLKQHSIDGNKPSYEQYPVKYDSIHLFNEVL